MNNRNKKENETNVFPIDIMVKITEVGGSTRPYLQGGSVKLTIPSHLAEEFKLKEQIKKKKKPFSYLFLNTDKGILLVPMDTIVNPENVKRALAFANISNLNDEDLKILFEDEE